MEPANNPVSMSDQNLAIIERRANTLGLHSFILLASPKVGEYRTLFAKMTAKSAFQALFAGMSQSIQMDKDNHPEYSTSHRAALDVFLKEINECVTRLNNKLK